MPITNSKPVPRPYTDEDRARLLAPIPIRSFNTQYAGKSWGGAFPADRQAATGRRYSGDRYGYVTDHRDLDAL